MLITTQMTRRPEDEAERHRRRLRDLGDHQRATVHVRRQVAGDEELLHHQRVANGQRLVEPEVVAHRAQRLLVGVPSGDARGGVDARRGEEDEERHHADREEDEDHRQEAADGEAQHQSPPPRSLARGSRASRTPSPSTFSARTVTAIATPGAIATRGRV